MEETRNSCLPFGCTSSSILPVAVNIHSSFHEFVAYFSRPTDKLAILKKLPKFPCKWYETLLTTERRVPLKNVRPLRMFVVPSTLSLAVRCGLDRAVRREFFTRMLEKLFEGDFCVFFNIVKRRAETCSEGCWTRVCRAKGKSRDAEENQSIITRIVERFPS